MKLVGRKRLTSGPLVSPENTNARPRDTFTPELIKLRRSLHQRALFLSQDRTAAEDLLQETLERALHCRDRFRIGSNLGAWVFSIMRNLFIDGRRRRAIRSRLEQRALWLDGSDAPARDEDPRRTDAGRAEISASEPPPITPLDILTLDDVDAVVATLPAAQQQIFRLAYGDRLTYRQIATRLGIPPSTTGTRLMRARDKVRRRLASLYEERVRERG